MSPVTEPQYTVFGSKPILKKIIDQKGQLPLITYFEQSLSSPAAVLPERQQELLDVVYKKTAFLLGPKIAESAVEQLKKIYYASTADHHEPICHPFFSNSHLAQSLANQKNNWPHVIVFACGGISLNNSSFPRGLLFHDRMLHEHRLHLFSLKNAQHPVYGLPAYTNSGIETMKREVRALHLPAIDTEALVALIDEVYASKQALSLQSFSDQISLTNFHFWKKIPGQEKTNLIYLEVEELVRILLLHHLTKSTIINQLLFDRTTQEIFKKNFDGITGAFSSATGKGTYLFWGIDDAAGRIALHHDGQNLVGKNGAFMIPLTPEALTKALEEKRLMPSMALSLVLLGFYYGLRCGGGFSQVNYLTEMKTAWLKLLDEAGGDKTEKNITTTVNTDFFCGEFILASLANKNSTIPATSLDLILYKDDMTAERITKAAKETALEAAVDHMMPEFYKIITGKTFNYTHRFPLPSPSVYV